MKVPRAMVMDVRDRIQDYAQTNSLWNFEQQLDDLDIARSIKRAVDAFNSIAPFSRSIPILRVEHLASTSDEAVPLRYLVLQLAASKAMDLLITRFQLNEGQFTDGSVTYNREQVWKGMKSTSAEWASEAKQEMRTYREQANLNSAWGIAPSAMAWLTTIPVPTSDDVIELL